MAKYGQFDTVLLKDGQIGTITDVFEPDTYFVDIGTSPKDWDNITVTNDEINRLATQREIRAKYEISKRELKEQGLWEDSL